MLNLSMHRIQAIWIPFFPIFFLGYIYPGLLECWHNLRAFNKAATYSQFLYVHVGKLKLDIYYVQDSVNSCSLSRHHHKCRQESVMKDKGYQVKGDHLNPAHCPSLLLCQLIVSDFSYRKYNPSFQGTVLWGEMY